MDFQTFLIVLCAAAFHAIWNFFAKTTNANKIAFLTVGQLLVGLSTSTACLIFMDLNHFHSDWITYIFLTSFFHAIYIGLLGWSYSVGELSLVYPVARGLGVALTSLVAVCFGIDIISLKGAFGIGAMLLGVLLLGLSSLPKKEFQKSFAIAILVGLSISSYSIVDKLAVAHIPPLLYVSLMNLFGPLFVIPFLMRYSKQELNLVFKEYRAKAFSVCFCGLITYFLILWAFQRSPASYVVALRETSVVFAALLGIFLLKESFSVQKMTGIILIALAAIMIKSA